MRSEELIRKIKDNDIPDGTKIQAKGYDGNLLIDKYGHLRLEKEYWETADGHKYSLDLYCVVDMLTNPNTEFKIEGIEWKPYEEKTNKYKLIDILNKIANGELKEGTKVIWGEEIYTYHGDDELYRTKGTSDFDLWDEMYLGSLNEEVELIEPNDFGEADKMIEPTDNTKIEELDAYELNTLNLFYKLNEVIRILNKRG